MFSTKKPKQARTVKAAAGPSQERRTFLRVGAVGALGAAAAIAMGSVLTGTPVSAAAQVRAARKAGEVRAPAQVGDDQTGGARKMRSKGAIGLKGEPTTDGARTLRKATRATQKTPKLLRTAKGTGDATRSKTLSMTRIKATPRSAKAMKPAG